MLADADNDFLDVTAYALRRAGFVVTTVDTGSEALESWRAHEPDIVLLDTGLAEFAGINVCETIRSSSTTPVVLVSGTRRESDIIRGFETGADDYMTKPFSIQHLVMRLRAICRRTTYQGGMVVPKQLVIHPLVIDLDSFSVLLEGKPVQMTKLEFRVLYYLSANIGRVVATPQIIDFAWGMDGEGDGSLLKTHISHIRRKLREVSDWPISLRAFAGVGYSLHIGAAESAAAGQTATLTPA